MKTSPFKVTAGGVTPPIKEEPVVEPKSNTKVGDAIADFLTPDSIGEALMNFIPFGGVGGKAIGKTKVFKELMNKVPGLNKFFKSGKKMTKNQGFDFKKGLDDGLKAKGGVVGDDLPTNLKVANAKVDERIARYGDASNTIYPKVQGNKQEAIKAINELTDNTIKGHQEKWAAMKADMPNFSTKQLDPKKVKNLGTSSSGQTVYEVEFPNGTKQKMWNSTGTGNKAVSLSEKNKHMNAANSKGYFGPVMGNVDGTAAGYSKSWYIKANGWERGYGSEMIEDTQIWLKSMKESGAIK